MQHNSNIIKTAFNWKQLKAVDFNLRFTSFVEIAQIENERKKSTVQFASGVQ